MEDVFVFNIKKSVNIHGPGRSHRYIDFVSRSQLQVDKQKIKPILHLEGIYLLKQSSFVLSIFIVFVTTCIRNIHQDLAGDTKPITKAEPILGDGKRAVRKVYHSIRVILK